MIEFMGKQLANPLIASSCIATESIANVLRLAENGVQGAILKSCADYERGKVSGKREFAVDKELGYTYASAPFESEILTLDECLEMLQTLRPQTEILLIPSFTALSLAPEDWIPACQQLEAAGADGLQLDFFYMGNLIGTDGLGRRIASLLRELNNALHIPVMPKLNINLPKDYIMPLLVDGGVQYVSLLDSVRSPYLRKAEGEYHISDRRQAYICLITAARTYDDYYYPLFGPPVEQFIEEWLSETTTPYNSTNEELLSLFGQCLNQEIQNGRFNFIKRSKYITFDPYTYSAITDEDYIYIETSVIAELATNTMQLHSVNALTDALKANECLHINDHHSKCYRFLVQNSAGEAYWLYTYGISKLLITTENRQKIACADLQRYFLDTSDFENAEILPLGISKDGHYLGKDISSKCKRNDSIFITGQSGTGKSFCGINLLPSFAMLGHRVICFDVSSSFTKEETLRALPENIVNTLFSFIPVKQGERLPIDPLFIGDCNGLPAKKRRVVSFITTAVGKLDNEEVKILDGLVSDMLKKHSKIDTVPMHMLHDMLQHGGNTGKKVLRLIHSVLNDIQTIGCQKQGWNQFFEAFRKIPVILLENEEDSRVHPLLDVLLASLWAWQREHKSVPLAIAIDELKQQSFTNGSPLHSILTEGRKFGAKLIGMTQDYISRDTPSLEVMRQAGIKIFFAPSKSHEKIASELGYSNTADAGFGTMSVGDLVLKADLFNKIDGTNEPAVIPGRTVRFVDSPLYAWFQREYGNILPECKADDNSELK